ncbi:MAG: S-methyl-5'-thioadenosine phosphorylase [Desulfitobacteriia bacterium]|jgi:5'-methylthioadenosine phosphorylase
MNVALIGGTGVEKLEIAHKSAFTVETPYGTVNLEKGFIGSSELVFLKRHGDKHSLPPHAINYRGNIYALHKIGIKKIIATGAVGSIVPEFEIGDLVLVDQFLDFTKNRPLTYYEGGEDGVLHVDVSEPYCPDLRKRIVQSGVELGFVVKNGGVYVCTEGPRFETPAEIKMFEMLCGQVVGMTGVPEVVLARELGLCYAFIALVTNKAAGVSKKPLTHSEVIATMKILEDRIAKLIEITCKNIDNGQRNCDCSTGNSEAGLF